MPNNFKLTGDYYVSVDGSDANNGLTKDTPKRTVAAGLALMSATGKTLIIGNGVYKENISAAIGANGFVKGDGVVILQGTANGTNAFSITSGNLVTYSDLIFNKYSTAGSLQTSTLLRCSFIDCTPQSYASTYISCIFINAAHGQTGGFGIVVCNYCIFINSPISAIAYISALTNSYFDSSSIVYLISSTTHNYNNLRGGVIVNTATSLTSNTPIQDIYGRWYNPLNAGSGGDGSVGNPYGRALTSGVAFSYANHRILYPTINVNSISADPQFNNIQTQDFTLQSTSPMIARASDGISNIGGTKYALRYTSKGSVLNSGAVSVTNLAFLGNDYIVSGATNGEVISSPIQISSSPKVVQKVTYNGLLEFNKALGAGPVAGNRNVPDNYVFGTGTQGANPDRLVYELRYSTQPAQPATTAEWDNGGYITAGNYFTMEWNTKPSFDTAFVGNGGATFNAADTPTFINATWIQLKIVLRNNYV